MTEGYESLPAVLQPRPGREENAQGVYEGGGVISYKRKPSTSVRLHELGHKVLGHEPGRMSLSKFIDQELDAESFSYRARSKTLTHRIGLPILVELIEDWGLSPSEATNYVVWRLNARGIPVSASRRRELNYFAHGLYPKEVE